MTSLSETYLSCKTAMATKLNNKGITAASANDGLTTLINYIDDIAPGVNGLLLSADKSIGQSSNTVNFTALYVSDGNVVSGKSVNFYGLKSATSTSKSLTANTWTPVGCKYSINVPSGAGTLQLTKYNSSYQAVSVVWAEGIIAISGDGATYNGVSNIVFEDGILSFTYNGNTVTKDISSFDCTEVNTTGSGVTIDDYGVFDTTDANGVATAQYTCTGAGKFDVQAISGSVVSEPYEVCDATFYDKGIDGTGNHNDNWGDNGNKGIISRDAIGTTFSAQTGKTWVQFFAQSISTFFTNPFTVEFEVLSTTNSPCIRFTDGTLSKIHQVSTGLWKITIGTNNITVLKDGQSQTHYLSGLEGKNCKVFFELSENEEVVKYKEFRIYPSND